MKLAFAPLLLVLLIPAVCFGQIVLQHPDDPKAEFAGRFQVTAIPGQTHSRLSIESLEQGDCQIAATVIAWRTVGGRVDYILDPASIGFTGSCCDINSVSTSDIFDQLSRAGLEQGILLALSSCPASCSSPGSARVYTASCVQRTGSCSSTAFTPCGESLSYREYTYCCINGVPVITELPGAGGSCTAPCESTTGIGSAVIE